MNDFDKGFMMGTAMGGDDDLPQGGCFSNMINILGFGVILLVGAFLAVLILIWLIGGR